MRKPLGYKQDWQGTGEKLKSPKRVNYGDENENSNDLQGSEKNGPVFRKSKKMLETEARIGEPIEDFIKREYIDNRKHLSNVAKSVGYSHRHIYKLLNIFNIPRRENSRPRGYFKSWNNIKREFEAIIDTEYRDPNTGELIKESDRFPTTTQLNKIDKSLLDATRKYHHIGITGVRKRMGYKVKNTKSEGYWKDPNNIAIELQPYIDMEIRDDTGRIIKKSGEYPSSIQIPRGILAAIERNHKSWGEFRKLMRGSDAPKFRLRILKNAKEEMQACIDREIIDEDGNVVKPKGTYPFSDQVPSYLASAIFRHHGGWNTFREIMGYGDKPKKSKRILQIEGRIGEPIEDFIRREYIDKGRRQKDVAKELGYTQIAHIVKDFNLKKKNKPINWKDPNNIAIELQPYIDMEIRDEDGILVKLKGELPSCENLPSNIKHAINRYGGYNKFKKEFFGIDVKERTDRSYLKDFEAFQRELRKIIEELGRFPKYSQMPIHIQKKISLHGGIDCIKAKMGYAPVTTPDQFSEFVASEQQAQDVIRLFDGNPADVADVLAVIYDGRISDDNVFKFLEEPSLREWLGEFQTPIVGITEFIEITSRLTTKDKDGIISDLLFKKALDYRSRFLGPDPSPEQRQEFLDELNRKLETLE